MEKANRCWAFLSLYASINAEAMLSAWLWYVIALSRRNSLLSVEKWLRWSADTDKIANMA
jgi:hypothetical protein